MNDRNIAQKSQEILEFPKVLQQLSGYTLSVPGKQRALSIRPSTKLSTIRMWQEQIREVIQLSQVGKHMPLSHFEDLTIPLKRLDKGAVLSGQEIAHIGQVLQISHDIYSFFEHLKEEDHECAELYQLTDELIPIEKLERKIFKTVTPAGEIKDSASSKLQNLRSQILVNESNIRKRLDQLIKGSKSKYLSDSIVTMRNDRYVIPVKSEYRAHFGGVVHDQSATGQTVFIEPKSILDLNNKLRQIESDIYREIQRILQEVSEACVPFMTHIQKLLRLLIIFDLILAKAKYAIDINAIAPKMNQQARVHLLDARHPLIPADEVVANDIVIEEDIQTVILTGPNTGGKTVVLKTVGLLQLMAQSGLHIPADIESELGIFEGIYADIGDEQSIEQNLSTFSSHLTTIVEIIAKSNDKSLVLLDELGAGTDPQEGASLAIAILDHFHQKNVTVMVSSHYPELKAYGYNQESTINASMEFNPETLEPTYRYLSGIPGRSNALEIAGRLGLDDEIIRQAKSGISGQTQQVDQMIQDLNEKQQMAEKREHEFHKKLLEAEKIHRELQAAYQSYEQEKEKMYQKAQSEAEQKVEQAKYQADQIISEIRQMQMDAKIADPVKEHELIDAKSRLNELSPEQEALKKNKVLKKAKESKSLKEGQNVRVDTIDQQGILVEKLEDKYWTVQLGMMKLKVSEDDLTVLNQVNEENNQGTSIYASTGSIKSELDLRGMRVEEALNALEQYIDQALLSNLGQVTIIHGLGTGAVRKATQERLSQHPRVKDFSRAPANQGGSGATVVKLK